ncbi:MAG: glycosyltransferase family 4 protein [Candidatus Sulfobium sp.]
MRVAVIKSNYTPYGGAEKYAYHLVNAFADRGYATDVLTASKERWVEGKGINRVFIPINRFNNLSRLYTFNRGVVAYLRKCMDDYDCVLDMDRTVLHTHIRAGGGSHRAWLERRRKVSPFLKNISFSLNPFHNYMLTIEKLGLENPRLKKLICISQMVKEDFLDCYDFDPQKIEVMHNGVEWEGLRGPFEEATQRRNEIRSALMLRADRYYYLYVGSGYERKGVHFIIRALELLPRDCSLIVIGKDRNEGRYRRLARERDVADRILFLGPRKKDEVIRYLQVADCFVLPSVYEPFGSAAIEALAMGLFTVVSASTGCGEIIREGCGAVVRAPWEPEELAGPLGAAGHVAPTLAG